MSNLAENSLFNELTPSETDTVKGGYGDYIGRLNLSTLNSVSNSSGVYSSQNNSFNFGNQINGYNGALVANNSSFGTSNLINFGVIGR